MRELADVLTWAHARGLHHRTLTPDAVLVVRPDAAAPTLKLFNWQAGSLGEHTADSSTLTWHDFLQVGLGGRDANAVYLAPELRGGGRPDAALLDVFSLGALAYHLLSGRPPAASPEDLLQGVLDSRRAGRPCGRSAGRHGRPEPRRAGAATRRQFLGAPERGRRSSCEKYDAVIGVLIRQSTLVEPGG